MAKTASYTQRLDADLKNQAEALYNELGMSLGTAITVFFFEKICQSWRLPF